MVRIGILLTTPKTELKKGELVDTSHLEWTETVSKKFVYKRDKECPQKFGRYGIPADVAIGAYIQNALNQKDVEVDYIMPTEISSARLKSNDLNFMLIYDILEAFHTDKTPNKRVYHNLKKCLLEAKNVYPPREYQEFIYSKINYYNYLQEHKVDVLPTFTMTEAEYRKMGHKVAVDRVYEFQARESLGPIIGKPVYGQEGKDIEWFEGQEDRVLLSSFLKTVMKKYPGVVFQQMVKSFGDTTKCPELRMFFLGNDYKYSVCAIESNGKCFFHPESEGGTLKAPMPKLKAVTQKILKKLPAIVMPNGVRLPRLITRLDMGYIVDGKYRPFVNEVEFVPSLYSEYKPLRKELIGYIGHCAKQMVKITRHYVEKGKVGRKQAPLRSQSSPAKRVLKRHILKRTAGGRVR